MPEMSLILIIYLIFLKQNELSIDLERLWMGFARKLWFLLQLNFFLIRSVMN